MNRLAFVALMLAQASVAMAQDAPYYSQGDFKPGQRVTIALQNPLDEARRDSPVIIRRADLPMLHDVHELSITLVDPAGTSRPEPSAQTRAAEGAHGRVAEANGRSIDYQFDDLDGDGLWDELFFTADFEPGETKAIHAYPGEHQRGWNPHRTHAAIGSYMRHTVPFWESGNVGWKLWYPTDIDVYAKRTPQLMANRLYMENLDGYAVSLIDPGLGSDIMMVADSFGGGGIGVFDDVADPAAVSRPRFTSRSPVDGNFNGGAASDTRYAFSVLANGPLRSMVRVRTMNWDSGKGQYEAEQVYTAYAGQDYTTAKVHFPRFDPAQPGAAYAVGIRKRPGETGFVQDGGMVVTTAPEVIRNPDDLEAVQPDMAVDFAGTALVVRNEYAPTYVFSPTRGGNHLLRIEPTAGNSFEYLLAAGWSEGAGPATAEAFQAYVGKVAREYAAPIRFVSAATESRSGTAGSPD